MKRFRKFLTAALAALTLVTAVPAHAQQYAGRVYFLADAKGVSDVISAVSTDVAIYVRFVGVSVSGQTSTVAISGNNSAAFVANGAADTTINTTGSTQCGATQGTLDLTNANCNTVGKMIDRINASSNWVAVPGGALRTDTSNGNLANLSATAAEGPDGVAILWNTPTFLNITLDLQPFPGLVGGGNQGPGFAIPKNSIQRFMTGYGLRFVNPNPFGGQSMRVFQYMENIAFSGGTPTVTVYGVYQRFQSRPGTQGGTAQPGPYVQPGPTSGNPGQPGFQGAQGIYGPFSYVESVRTIWTENTAATTVQLIRDAGAFGGFIGNPGERILIRVGGGTTLTAPTIVAHGAMFRQP